MITDSHTKILAYRSSDLNLIVDAASITVVICLALRVSTLALQIRVPGPETSFVVVGSFGFLFIVCRWRHLP